MQKKKKKKIKKKKKKKKKKLNAMHETTYMTLFLQFNKLQCIWTDQN